MRERLLIAISGLALNGCAKHIGAPTFAGKWTGDPPMPAELASDPRMKEVVDAMKDSIVLQLYEDKTFDFECVGTRQGTWSAHNRLIEFTETSVRSGFGGFAMFADFGRADAQGRRRYDGVVDPDGKTLTMSVGRRFELKLRR